MSLLDRDVERVDPSNPEIGQMLAQLQGNILKGHGRNHTVHIFFRFGMDTSQNQSLLKDLGALVTSMKEQLSDSEAWKQEHGPKDLSFRSLFLTKKGYLSLGFTKEQLLRVFEETSNGVKFWNGMAAHQGDLSDPAVTEWEAGYADPDAAGEGAQIIDGMVLIANDDLGVLQIDERDIRKEMTKGRAEILVTERGTALFNKAGSQNLEHFGYVDGRSQPIFLNSDLEREKNRNGGTDRWNPAAKLRLVLVQDKLAKGDDSDNPSCFGSYFVFRKLEQNVKGFKEKEEELATALSLSGDDEELAGAMAVGRFEDGTPVLLRPFDGLAAPVPNNFTFGEDPQGLKCPLHAHIRKVNPRGDTIDRGAPKDTHEAQEDDERSHRIVRRGITYGFRTVEPKNDPEPSSYPLGGVGLLFMCYQSNIDNQFAYIQRKFANTPGAPGMDPVIGQPTGDVPHQHKWPKRWGHTDMQEFGFPSFVTLLGGEFFFAPSMSFLKDPTP